MTGQAEIQDLLRFLAKDAKLSLPDALPAVAVLRKHNLYGPDDILKTKPELLQSMFGNEKLAKQVLSAAKRLTTSKKRSASSLITTTEPKRIKTGKEDHGSISEESLALPESHLSLDELSGIEIETNRAPLVLAFAVTVLKFTMPEQPLSSRLSLAQALVSANSQSKAQSIGLDTGTSAEDEGWAEGQPKVKVLSRNIPALRRYHPPNETDNIDPPPKDTFWGLDLEALRKSNGPLVAGKSFGSTGPPIYSPASARAYLLKSMTVVAKVSDQESSKVKKKQMSLQTAANRENALAMVIKAIEILCESWMITLSASELDSRAWSWYVRVRPDVAQGQAGWGQKGKIALKDILDLRPM